MTAKKRLIRNIILALLAVAILGGGYYLALVWEPGDTDTPNEYNPNATYVVYEKFDDVSSIDIKNPDGSYTIVKNKDKDDKITYSISASPYTLDSYSIGNTFTSLLGVSALRTVTDDTLSAANYGIDNSSPGYSIIKTDNSRTTVIIGDEIPTGGEFYCMQDGGDKIYTVSSTVASLVMRGLQDYRPRGILNLSSATDIGDFTLYHNGKLVVRFKETTEEERRDAIVPSQWIIEKPWFSEIDAEKVTTLFESFINISATGFPQDNENPVFDYLLEIRVGDKNYSLSIGGESPSGGVYLRDNSTNLIYIVGFPIRTAVMGIDPLNYATKLVNLEKIKDVSSISIQKGNSKFVMKTDGYIINGEKTDEETFKKTYQNVMSIAFMQIGGNAPAGEPYISISFEQKDGTKKITKYYDYDERSYIALRSDNTSVLLLKSELKKIESLFK